MSYCVADAQGGMRTNERDASHPSPLVYAVTWPEMPSQLIQSERIGRSALCVHYLHAPHHAMPSDAAAPKNCGLIALQGTIKAFTLANCISNPPPRCQQMHRIQDGQQACYQVHPATCSPITPQHRRFAIMPDNGLSQKAAKWDHFTAN